MRKCRIAPAIFLLLSASPAFSQYATVIQACSRDLMQFCAPAQGSGTPLTECVKLHFQEFTEPCKAALVRIAPVRESCGADIQAQCPTVKPTGGRVFLCVREHFAALSEGCKDAIGRAAAKKTAVRRQ